MSTLNAIPPFSTPTDRTFVRKLLDFFGLTRTAAEILNGVPVVDQSRRPGDFVRYGLSETATAAENATAINAALASNSMCWCTDPGTYEVDDTLDVRSNQTIFLAQGVTILAAVRAWNGTVWLFDSVDNVLFQGGVLEGNKDNNPTGVVFGFRIMNSSKVTIRDAASNNCPSDNVTLGAGGDGFYIGGFAGASPGSSNIELHGCTATGNVRQGLSIVRADGVSVIGGSYSGTTGNNPGGGIDVEANPGLGSCRNIRIVGVELADNYISLVLTESSFNVVVSGCSMIRSRSVSLQMTDAVNAVIVGNLIQPAMTVSGPIVDFVASENVVFSGNYIEGQGAASSVEGAGIRFAISSTNVSITNNTFKSTRGQALSLGNSGSTGVPTLINFSDNVLIDCLDPVSSPGRGSIAIGGNTGTGQFPLLATVRNNIIYDTRGTPADFGITLTNVPAATSAGYRIDGNRIQGPVTPFSGSVSTVPPLCGVVTWNPGNLVDGAGETSPNITVTGAALGDAVEVYPPYSLQGFVYSGYVSAADTVVVRIQNETTGTVDLGSGSWCVRVRKLLQY